MSTCTAANSSILSIGDSPILFVFDPAQRSERSCLIQPNLDSALDITSSTYVRWNESWGKKQIKVRNGVSFIEMYRTIVF